MMSPNDLYGKAHDEPFKPFRVRLANKSTIDVLHPRSVVVGPTRAIMPLMYGKSDRGLALVLRWRPVDLADIVGFSDVDEKHKRPKDGWK